MYRSNSDPVFFSRLYPDSGGLNVDPVVPYTDPQLSTVCSITGSNGFVLVQITNRSLAAAAPTQGVRLVLPSFICINSIRSVHCRKL